MIPSPAPFRKKLNWLAALMVEAIAPVMRWYARGQTGAATLPPRLWRRVLILGDNHIGDLLYRTCSLRALKTGLPECDFYYLAAANTADILDGNPFLKAVVPWARSDSCLDLSLEHMEQLQELNFDAAMCTNCIRYWPELLLALRLGIPNRASYTYKGFSGWVTHPIPIRYPQPFPAYFRDFVATLTERPGEDDLKPQVFLTRAAENEAAAAWSQLNLHGADPVIALFLTSRQDTELWALEDFKTLLKLIRGRQASVTILLGSPRDRIFLGEFASKLKPELNLPIYTSLSLPGLAAFLKRCKLVIAKDSGPRHIANAVGTPVLFFRSTSFAQVEAGNYCPTEYDLMPSGEFLPVKRQRSLLGRIEPADVFRHVERVLISRGQ